MTPRYRKSHGDEDRGRYAARNQQIDKMVASLPSPNTQPQWPRQGRGLLGPRGRGKTFLRGLQQAPSSGEAGSDMLTLDPAALVSRALTLTQTLLDAMRPRV